VLDSTCKIATAVCGANSNQSYVDEAACVAGLSGDGNAANSIQHQWGSLQGSLAAADDSLECRLYHAYTGQKDGTHCGHYNRTGGPCNGRVAPNAAHYCDTLMHNCGSNVQYNSAQNCLAVAAAFTSASPDSASATNNANSLGCREYHAQAAAFSTAHCEHGGPSGGNVCGKYSDALETIATLCPADDVSTLRASVNATLFDTLIPIKPTGAYTTTLDQSGNTQACRIYHLTATVTDAAAKALHCPHGRVSGGGACGVPATTVDHLCNVIGATCGFGTAAWQHASAASCKTDLTSVALGVVLNSGAYANNTMECRFYHAAVAAQWAPGAKNAGVANATDMFQYHCGHVLKTATAGGCGYVAPPTSVSVAPTAAAAPTPKTSSASALSSLASLIAVAVSAFFL